MKKKLYIGCALTNVPSDKREILLEMIFKIKAELRKSFEILEFLGLVGLSTLPPQQVYIHDIKNSVMKADCMLAIVDYPSLGLGYEIATAVEKQGIPVLAVAHKDSIVTRLIRGIDHKNFHFMYYDSVNEIIAKTIKTLTK
jgi:hypothetical protein